MLCDLYEKLSQRSSLVEEVISPENLRHYLNQSDSKLKNKSRVSHVFPRFIGDSMECKHYW